MKILLFLLAMISTQVFAEDSRALETVEESRLRHEANRYEQYRKNGNSEPLGGYSEKLGDPSPRGANIPNNDAWQPSGRNEDWRSRAKR